MPDDFTNTGAASFDGARLRQVMGHFCTGVTVITGIEADQPVGLTANAFMSLSLDPPLALFAAQRSSTTWPRIRAGGSFCVNFLAEEQEHVSRAFAAVGGDKFRGIGWTAGKATGTPVLDNVLGFVEVSIEQEYEGGDHTIVVGAIRDLGVRDGRPLLFYRGGYASLDHD